MELKFETQYTCEGSTFGAHENGKRLKRCMG
jgi:hypothetical protein